MSLPLPRLDDRTWQDLRDEAVALIPRYAPEWTNHNASDPGITLLELLAYHTEAELFRIDQVGDPHTRAFLRLLGDRYLPLGPRPPATLLVYDPLPGYLPARPHVPAGEYFVPRQSPLRATIGRRAAGEPIPPAAIRSSGEPDEPLLHPDPPPSRPPVPEYGFRAAHDLDLTRVRLGAAQFFDGRTFRDASDLLGGKRTALVWGADPSDPTGRPNDEQPAFYVGLNLKLFVPPFPDPDGWSLTLWAVPVGFRPENLSQPDGEPFHARAHVVPPAEVHAFVAQPAAGFLPYAAAPTPDRHHGLRVRWEYLTKTGWQPVPVDRLRDETRGFTRPGRIVIPGRVFADAGFRAVVGSVPAAHFYLRCRLTDGRPDAPPALAGLFADAVLAEQWDITRTPTTVAPPSVLRDLALTSEAEANVRDAASDLATRGWGPPAAAWGDYPLANLISNRDYGVVWDEAARELRAVVLGIGTGVANQRFDLPAPVDRINYAPETPDEEDGPPVRVLSDGLTVWTLEPPWAWVPGGPPKPWQVVLWQRTPDLGLASRRLPAFRYVAQPTGSRYTPPGSVEFGDGESGRVPPPGAVVLASYSWTYADVANFAAGYTWALSTDRERYHPELVTAAPTIRFRNPVPSAGGATDEPLTAAVGRFTNEFDAPERLVELAERAGASTLDTLDLSGISPPPAAVTPLDFECLTRSVPGTDVARSRAWAEADPRFPGAAAPGAVTVVIVPRLPADRPVPTPGLCARVCAYLETRRPLACRVFVVGPAYQPVRVTATISTAAGNADAVRQTATEAVKTYLHPLRGGPNGRGWPFGQDIFPGDLLRVLANVPGVTHITGLRLAADTGAWSEDPIGLPAMALPCLADVALDVREDA